VKTALTACGKCGGEIWSDSDFCPHCGFLLAAHESVRCEVHTSATALGVCIICHALVCKECTMERHGRIFCREHQDLLVEEDWVEVYASTDVNEAEMVKSILESAGHHVQVRDFGSIAFVWGGGESALSRSQVVKPARVFVPIPEFLEARRDVSEWKSATPN
jgi:RNA polymerase subunit RPABC4/transcription elongation factor Spt4